MLIPTNKESKNVFIDLIFYYSEILKTNLFIRTNLFIFSLKDTRIYENITKNSVLPYKFQESINAENSFAHVAQGHSLHKTECKLCTLHKEFLINYSYAGLNAFFCDEMQGGVMNNKKRG
jgi:hypothetical protein